MPLLPWDDVFTTVVVGVVGAVFALIVYVIRGFRGNVPWFVAFSAFFVATRQTGFLGGLMAVFVVCIVDALVLKRFFPSSQPSYGNVEVNDPPTPDVRDGLIKE